MAGPTILGRYELHGSIATGGMASIHLGRVRGAAGFERTVAIKRLHPHYASDPSFAAMFLDEARLVARIRHPNVVPIVDVVAEGDELFLVMEYVHGESLGTLVRPDGGELGSAVPPAIAAAIFIDVLHGLHAAHEATTAAGAPLGIVHRDVTPHNVLVGVDGASRIADFGIAMATQRSQKTQEGQLKGKLSYVAPEQLQGRAVERTTDVYSAAVSLWEALTGRMLFAGEHEGRIIERVLIGATKAPSAYVPEVPAALDDVVMRGLEMRPQKRFQSARDMALALEQSVALPPASEIGAWVTARAHAKLAKRAAAIEALDRAPELVPTGSTPPMRPPMPTPPLMPTPGPLAMPPRTPPPPAGSTPPSGPPPASSGPRWMTDAHAAPPPRRAWPLLVTLLVMALGGLVAGGVVWARARDRARDAPASSGPPPSSSWADYEAAPPSDTAAAPPPTASPTPTSNKPTYRPPRPAKSAAANDEACKPPYTRDSEGRKIYKRECL